MRYAKHLLHMFTSRVFRQLLGPVLAVMALVAAGCIASAAGDLAGASAGALAARAGQRKAADWLYRAATNASLAAAWPRMTMSKSSTLPTQICSAKMSQLKKCKRLLQNFPGWPKRRS
jgi:hypothetical protein